MPSPRNIEKQPVFFMKITTAVACTLLLPACVSTASTTPAQRIDTRSFPSVFQAWNPIDHPDWPQEKLDDRLKAAIDKLPDHYREVLLLWAIEGLKYREVAEVLDVPLGTVMSRLYRARAILSEQLADLAAESGINVALTDESDPKQT
jgi:DNA-directed RNA polymerase specialized sigma24 family protein